MKTKSFKFIIILSLIAFSCNKEDDNLQDNALIPIPTEGLLAYYPFNGNANDVSGNNYNGVIPSGDSSPELTSDKSGTVNSAYTITGQGIELPNFGDNLNAYSISLWYYDDGVLGTDYNNRTLIAKGDSTTNLNYVLRVDTNSDEVLAFASTGTPLQFCNTITSYDITVGQWNHVVLKVEELDWSIYINGQLAGENTLSSIADFEDNTITIGSGGLGTAFRGKLDDIAFYDRGLTDAEIQELASL